MTRSNRTLNRVILALVGLVALALSVAIALPALNAIGVTVTTIDPLAAVASLELAQPTALTVMLAASALIVIGGLAWMLSRGRGRTAVLHTEAGVRLDAAVLDDLLRAELTAVRSVSASSVSVHRLRGERVAAARLRVVPGAELDRVRDEVTAAADAAIARLGVPVPLVLHLVRGR